MAAIPEEQNTQRDEDAAAASKVIAPPPPLPSEHPLFDEVTIRSLRRDEMETACSMILEDNEWSTLPSLDFHYALHDAYPGGWLCATLGEAIVGTMFFATFPDGSGFGGYLFVRKDYRSKGVGKRLQDACLAHFEDANFGINALEHRVASNLRNGYRIVSFRILAFCGPVNGAAFAARLATLPSATVGGVSVAALHEPTEELLCYDAEVNAVRRDALVKLYTGLPESLTLVAKRRGAIVGYGTLHKGFSCYQISPLYADDAHVAELIFLTLSARILSGEALCYTAPALNAAAVALAESAGLPFLYATVRQYTRTEVALPLQKIYSIATEDASLA